MTQYTLDPWLQKTQAASTLLQNAANERNAGVNQLKTDSGYNDKQAALDTATNSLYEAQKRLDALPEQVQQRTAGRPVTQAQLDRITSSETNPLAKQAQALAASRGQSADSLSRVDQAVKDYVGQFNQDTSAKYQGLTGEADALFKQYQTGVDTDRYNQETQFKKDMAAIQQQQADRAYALQAQQLAAQQADQKAKQAAATKGQTSAYISDQQDRAANYAIAAGAKPGTPEYNKIYTETLKNSLYTNEPQYGDLGLDMSTIYKTRGTLDDQLKQILASQQQAPVAAPAKTGPFGWW